MYKDRCVLIMKRNPFNASYLDDFVWLLILNQRVWHPSILKLNAVGTCGLFQMGLISDSHSSSHCLVDGEECWISLKSFVLLVVSGCFSGEGATT